MLIDLTQVMTFSEAADKWGFANGNTIRKAVERRKFQPEEIRKSGDVWLTTYQAMVRVFGQPRKSETILSYEEISSLISSSVFLNKNADATFQQILSDMETAIQQEKTVTVIESKKHPERILSVIKTKDDVNGFKKIMERYLRSLSIKV